MSSKIIETLITVFALDASQYESASKKLEETKKKTEENVEKVSEKGDKKDKDRYRDKDKRERAAAARKRREAQESSRQNSQLRDELVGIGRAAAGMFLGFESIKGAIDVFNNYTNSSAGMGRNAQNLGVDVHEYQSLGAAVKLVGGNAEEAEQALAGMQQSIFALTTQGQRSPFVDSLQTMGVYLRDGKGQVRDLTALLKDLSDAMTRRGLSRPQQFQWLQQAGLPPGLINLLLDPNRNKLLEQASASSMRNQTSVDRSAAMQRSRENFKNTMGGLVDIGADTITGLLQGDYAGFGHTASFDKNTSKAALGARRSGSPYNELGDVIGDKYGLPKGLLGSVGYEESRFNPDAVNAKSGARGMMQLMPQFHPEAGKDPEKDMEEAARELQRLYKIFGTWAAALAAYNDGQGDLESLMRTGHRSKKGHEGETELPLETRKYVQDILGAPTPAAGTTGGGNTTHITVGDVTIPTTASTVSGLASDFSDTLRRKQNSTQANSGMQ